MIFGYWNSGEAGSDFPWEMWEYNVENMIFIRMRTDEENIRYQVADTFTTDTWVQVAFTYQQSTGYHRLYKDGVLLWQT